MHTVSVYRGAWGFYSGLSLSISCISEVEGKMVSRRLISWAHSAHLGAVILARGKSQHTCHWEGAVYRVTARAERRASSTPPRASHSGWVNVLVALYLGPRNPCVTFAQRLSSFAETEVLSVALLSENSQSMKRLLRHKSECRPRSSAIGPRPTSTDSRRHPSMPSYLVHHHSSASSSLTHCSTFHPDTASSRPTSTTTSISLLRFG